MKKRIAMMLVLASACSLIGCADKQNASSASSKKGNDTSLEEAFPSEYKTSLNGVDFDVMVEIPEGVDLANVKICRADCMLGDTEKIENVLTGDKDLESKDYFEGMAPDGTKTEGMYARFTDGGAAYSSQNGISYYTGDIVKHSYCYELYSDFDRYSMTDTFDFMTPDDAAKEVLGFGTSLGFDIGEYDYEYYAFDYETMAKYEVHENKVGDVIDNKKSDWSKDDNAYFIAMLQKSQGIPVYYGIEGLMEDWNLYERPVRGFVTKNGVRDFVVTSLYDLEEEEEGVYTFLPFENCAKTVAKKYGDTLSGATYKVVRAKLYLIPQKSHGKGYDVKLGWLFEIEEEQNGEINLVYTLVDAQNAKEIDL